MESLGYFQDDTGHVTPTVLLTLSSGDATWLCDVYDEVVAAMDKGEPFEAHEVIGMKPRPIIVNPAHVETIKTGSGS